jgi:CHAT domain-containing protein
MRIAKTWDAGRQDLASASAPGASMAFPQLDSLVAAYAWIELAAVERLESRALPAEERLRRVVDYARQRNCLHLAGRALWPLALLQFERGDSASALETAQQALPLLLSTHDREAYAVLSGVIASIYQQNDLLEDAWRHAQHALAMLEHCRHLRRQSILTTAANLARGSGLFRAAAYFRGISVGEADASANWTTLAFLLPRYTIDLGAIGRGDDAVRAIRSAERALLRVEDVNTRELASIQLAIAHAQLEGTHAATQPLLHKAIAAVRRRGMSFQLPSLLALLSAQAAASGDRALAQASLDEAIRLLARPPASASRPASVGAVHAQAWDFTVATAEGLWRHGDRAGAYELLEDPPILGPGASQVVRLRYVVTASRILAVGHGPHGRIRFEVRRSAHAILSDVARLRRAMKRERELPALLDLLERLFTDLLEPVRSQVTGAAKLEILPDGPLHDLPFAALVDPATGRHVIESVSVQYGDGQHSMTGDPSRAALLVAVDTPARHAALPHVRDEVRKVASVYREARVVEGTRGTVKRLVSEMGASEVFHFAGHAIVNRVRPERSQLVLDDAVLSAEKIDQLSLPRLQLVVLSACRTASGLPAGREGRMGLPASFLRAGAESVVATQWEVEDETSKDVAILLHRHWTRGLSPADALRAAQLDVLSGQPGRPWTWASFMVIQAPS